MTLVANPRLLWSVSHFEPRTLSSTRPLAGCGGGSILLKAGTEKWSAKVDCEFRPVDPKWARHLMLGANWFYRATEYPVIQAVYPDLDNRFPEDTGFDRNFSQPLLQTELPVTELENAFWKATE